MNIGFRNGILRLVKRADHATAAVFSGRLNQVKQRDASEHDLRDLGLLDGRVSPSTVQRVVRPDVWDIIEQPPHWL